MSSCIDKYSKRREIILKALSNKDGGKGVDIFEECYKEKTDDLNAKIGYSYGFFYGKKTTTPEVYICCFYEDEYDVFLYDDGKPGSNFEFDCLLTKEYFSEKNYNKNSPFYKLKCKSEGKIKNKTNDYDKTTPKDNINPNHYKSGKYECIEEMIQMFGIEAVKNFCMCNVYKYRYRANQKNGEEDIKKAEKYMEFLMNLDEYGTVHSPETTNNNK